MADALPGNGELKLVHDVTKAVHYGDGLEAARIIEAYGDRRVQEWQARHVRHLEVEQSIGAAGIIRAEDVASHIGCWLGYAGSALVAEFINTNPQAFERVEQPDGGVVYRAKLSVVVNPWLT